MGGESNILFPQIRGGLHPVTLGIGISTATSNDTLMYQYMSHVFSIQKGTVIVANGFDRTGGTLLLPLDFKNIINMKCDMYDGTIILKYDTELMTSDEQDALALFFTVVFCYLSINTVTVLLLSCINSLSADRLFGSFLPPCHLLNSYSSHDFIRTR